MKDQHSDSILKLFGASATERVKLAVESARRGRPVLMLDDDDRENEADMIVPAEGLTAETMAMMIRHGSGIVCLCLTGERLDTLGLPPMVAKNTNGQGTAFTVSIEAGTGVTTGVSAVDRVRTIEVAIDAASGPDDLARPGHVFPLRARDGGVLTRRGHTEGSVDLARLAGLEPAAVLCELMNDDGTMSRGVEVIDFALTRKLAVLSVGDIAEVRAGAGRKLESAPSSEPVNAEEIPTLRIGRRALVRQTS